MNIQEAINYLKKHKITVNCNGSNYSITNPQNFTLNVTENAVITYALSLKSPTKVTSLVEEFHKTYWK